MPLRYKTKTPFLNHHQKIPTPTYTWAKEYMRLVLRDLGADHWWITSTPCSFSPIFSRLSFPGLLICISVRKNALGYNNGNVLNFQCHVICCCSDSFCLVVDHRVSSSMTVRFECICKHVRKIVYIYFFSKLSFNYKKMTIKV